MSHYDIDIYCRCGNYIHSSMDIPKRYPLCPECQEKLNQEKYNEQAKNDYPEMFITCEECK